MKKHNHPLKTMCLYIYIYKDCTYFWTDSYLHSSLQNFNAVEFGNKQ